MNSSSTFGLEELNHTELYQTCREAGIRVSPDSTEAQMISYLVGDEDPPPLNETTHPIDGWRHGIIGFLSEYWSNLEPQIKCPAKNLRHPTDPDPRPCFGCLDSQAISCISTVDGEVEQLIQLHKPAPTPEPDTTRTDRMTVTSLQTAPRDIEGLKQLKEGVLFRLGIQLGMFADSDAEKAFLSLPWDQRVHNVLEAIKLRDANSGEPPMQQQPPSGAQPPPPPQMPAPAAPPPQQAPPMQTPPQQGNIPPVQQQPPGMPPLPPTPQPQAASQMPQPQMPPGPSMGAPQMPPGQPYQAPAPAAAPPPQGGTPQMPPTPQMQMPPTPQTAPPQQNPSVDPRQPPASADFGSAPPLPSMPGAPPLPSAGTPQGPSMPQMPQPGTMQGQGGPPMPAAQPRMPSPQAAAPQAPSGDIGQLLSAIKESSEQNQRWLEELHRSQERSAAVTHGLVRIIVYLTTQVVEVDINQLRSLVNQTVSDDEVKELLNSLLSSGNG